MRDRARSTLMLPAHSLVVSALVGFALLFANLMEPSSTGALAQLETPSLRLVRVSGYRLAVDGQGWPSQKRLVVAFRAGSWLGGLELQTTLNGSFRVGMNNLDRCGTGVTVTARDFGGHTRQLRAPALLCPPLPDPPTPALTLLQSRPANPLEVRSIAPAAPSSVTLKRGNHFYLWEPGKDQPAFTAAADENYLLPFGQGPSAAPGCTQSCDLGFYWEWVAVKNGRTAVDLSPACRQSSPPCAAPDLRIDVQIHS